MADREEIKEIVEEIMEDIIDERVAEAVRDLINCGDLTLSMPEPEMDDDDWDEDDDMDDHDDMDDNDDEDEDPYDMNEDDDEDDDVEFVADEEDDDIDDVNMPDGYEPVADTHASTGMGDYNDWDGGDATTPDDGIAPVEENSDPAGDMPSDTHTDPEHKDKP